MSLNLHVDYIRATADTRLHYLKRLRSAGLSAGQLTHWYISVIWPVLEYCAVVWHRTMAFSCCL